MKTFNSSLVVLLSAVLVAGCSDGPADDLAPPAAIEAAGASEPADETGNTEFSDGPGDEGDVTYPLAGAAEFPDDSPSEVPTSTTPASSATPLGYVDTALVSPNKFFKRQVRHPKWNPTGPLFSGNCAPTSLAMAAKVFGKEPAGLTIEQSIDRVRVMMNKPSDGGGATSAQVRLGAQRLGLKLRAMAKG